MDRFRLFPSGELGMHPTGNWTPYDDAQRALDDLKAQLEALRQERDEARHSRDVFKSQMIAHMNDRDSYAEDLTTLQAQAKQLDRTLADVYQQRDGLQAQLRQVEGARDHAKKMEAVQKEVADNQTWHVQKLKDWRDTVTLALQRPGGARVEDVPEHIKGLVRERDALSIWVNALRDSYDDLESRHADMLGDLTTLRQLVEALPVVEVDGVIVWAAPDESGWFVSKRPAPTGTYWAKFKTQEDAKSFLALLKYRATLTPAAGAP